MRQNLPVTPTEYDFPEGATLMSTTDLSSHISYANAAFIQVSGFTREELARQPHNIVRHPDMPVQAYADMWKTIKAGQSWTALSQETGPFGYREDRHDVARQRARSMS